MFAHIDADSFFASVLQRKYPRLRGKPLLALGMGGGCVIAASYEAKAKGVKTGMPLKEALELCPEAEKVASDFAETAIASHQIESIIQNHCPVIEQMSIDEWYLDLTTLVGGLPFDLLHWAMDIQREIGAMTGLSVSIGVAPTKLLAKLAGEYRKPAGCTVVEKHQLEQFLSDRPAPAISGIGRRRSVHAKANNWHTAWDIANADQEMIRKLFGKPGLEMQQELLGIPVFGISTEDVPPESISRTRSFKQTKDHTIAWAHLLQHVSYTVLKMRKQDLACRSISIWLRDHKYEHEGIQLRLPRCMDTEETITPYARKAFDRMVHYGTSYTQAGFCLWDLHPKSATQFSLFEKPQRTMREEDLQHSLDNLRGKYGREVVIRGSALPVFQKKERILELPFFT